MERLAKILSPVLRRIYLAFQSRVAEPLERRIRAFIDRGIFSQRDIRALKIASAALFVFALFFLYRGVYPEGTTRSEVSQIRLQLNEMRALKAEYSYSRDILAKMSGSMEEEKEALISVVEKTLIRNGIDRRSFSIKGVSPSSRSKGIERKRAVLVDINKVAVPRVLNVLYTFQKSKTILKVSDLRIKTRFDNPNLTDVSFRLSTFSFSES